MVFLVSKTIVGNIGDFLGNDSVPRLYWAGDNPGYEMNFVVGTPLYHGCPLVSL